ncbi:MAG TPA: MFS transporter [Candidatus Hydrogenedentes bacterium]|nr:MFS transporter [Candidatus Hydrogenedentota bacterium]
MPVTRWLLPKDTVSDQDVDRGMKMLLFDAAFAHSMNVLTGGAFLVAFALLLGASNKVIGFLAAAAPISQILHIPAIYLIERRRQRKALSITTAVIARSVWLLAALIPWFVPGPARIPAFLGCLLLFFSFGAVSGCSWNSWMRDLVPEKRMGRFFGKRMAIATSLGAVLSFSGGVGVDMWEKHFGTPLGAYSVLFASAGLSGLVALFFLSFVPEPKMPDEAREPMFRTLAQPFKDLNFRHFLIYVAMWSVAMNFAAPFFAVYMIKRLGLSMTWILGLSVVSQLLNIAFFGVWGRLADRFSNKSVISVTSPLFLACFMLWPLTTMPERHAFTIPILFAIHILGGITTAGFGICSSNLAFRSAPRGKATSYLAVNGLVIGAAAMLAPIAAGVAADFFENKELSIVLSATDKAEKKEEDAVQGPEAVSSPAPPAAEPRTPVPDRDVSQPPVVQEPDADLGIIQDVHAEQTLRRLAEWEAAARARRGPVIFREPEGETVRLPAMSLEGLDFVFVIAFLLGVLALHRLGNIKEEGEAEDVMVRKEFYSEMRRAARSVSSVSGLRHLAAVPYTRMRRAITHEKGAPPGEPPEK